MPTAQKTTSRPKKAEPARTAYPAQIRFWAAPNLLALTPRGTLVLADSSYPRVRFYPKGQAPTQVTLPQAPRAFTLSPEGSEIAVTYDAGDNSPGTLALLDADTGEERAAVEVDVGDRGLALAISPSGEHVALSSSKGLDVYSMIALREGRRMKPESSYAYEPNGAPSGSIVFAHDGRTVIGVSFALDGIVRYDARGGATHVPVDLGSDHLVQRRDGTLAIPCVVFDEDGKVHWRKPPRYAAFAAFSPDGRHLVCASRKGEPGYDKGKAEPSAFLAVLDAATGDVVALHKRDKAAWKPSPDVFDPGGGSAFMEAKKANVAWAPRSVLVGDEIVVVGLSGGAEVLARTDVFPT